LFQVRQLKKGKTLFEYTVTVLYSLKVNGKDTLMPVHPKKQNPTPSAIGPIIPLKIETL
jgi:hypothetical protein